MKIELTKKEKKVCFVISPIGDEDSETRKRSDKVLKHIITAPAEQLGYEVIRADKISEPGIITTQIIQHIVDADLVIADLTEKNPNVFYELALRHAIRKPLVQLIKKGEAIPFDIAATRIIQFDIQDLDSVESAKSEIISQVRSLESGKSEIHNPISVSIDLKMLKESSDPEERSLADVVEAISDLRVAMSTVEKKLNEGGSSKSLDEIKTGIENLPSKIENRLDPDLKRRRKFHPMMLEEVMHFGKESSEPYLPILIMISLFKDDLPWLYELGLQTYRSLKEAQTEKEKRDLVLSFEKTFEITRHPFIREFMGKSEEMYMFNHELRHFLHHFLERTLNGEKLPKSKVLFKKDLLKDVKDE